MTSNKQPEKVPKEAQWVQDFDAWELGKINESGNKDGVFKYWRPDGSYVGEYTWKNGVVDGLYNRYHDNGELAQKGKFTDNKLDGVQTYFRSTEKTSEDPFPSDLSPKIWKSENFYNLGSLTGAKWYDKNDIEVNSEGTPLSEIKTKKEEIPKKKTFPKIDISKLFSPANISDLENYTTENFSSDLDILFHNSARIEKNELMEKDLYDFKAKNSINKSALKSALAFDNLIKTKKIPWMDSLNFSYYGLNLKKNGLLAKKQPEKYIAISSNEGGDFYLFELFSGKIVFYDHETDEIIAKEYFENLDVYLWIMIRIAAIREGKVSIENFQNQIKKLNQPAGEIELSRL